MEQGALRNLLTGGDRAERVWAAWALAAILGRQAAPDLPENGEISQSAGTRRMLLVILAGLGERLIIRVMAEGDPSPAVRAASCQYLLQTWASDETDTAEFLKFCLFADPASEVRDEILKSATLDRLGLGLNDLVNLANDRSTQVRGRVLALVRDRYPMSEIAASGLFKRLVVEDKRALLVELGRLAMETDGPERVLAAAGAQSDESCLTLLDLLIEEEARFDWPALNGLASRRAAAVDLRVLRLLKPGSGPVAFAWLVHAIALRLAQPGVPDWDFIEESWQPLTDALADVPHAILVPLKANLEIIIRYAESIPEPEGEDARSGDRRHQFVHLRHRLTALINTAGGPA